MNVYACICMMYIKAMYFKNNTNLKYVIFHLYLYNKNIIFLSIYRIILKYTKYNIYYIYIYIRNKQGHYPHPWGTPWRGWDALQPIASSDACTPNRLEMTNGDPDTLLGSPVIPTEQLDVKSTPCTKTPCHCSPKLPRKIVIIPMLDYEWVKTD